MIKKPGIIVSMEAKDIDWSGCPLIETVPGLHSGDPVFVGSRLPVSAVVENYRDFLDEGMTPDEAIAQTLETYPSTPGGANAIRAVLDYRAKHQPVLQP
jgi:uncharacterized protein (DUF433 family)